MPHPEDALFITKQIARHVDLWFWFPVYLKTMESKILRLIFKKNQNKQPNPDSVSRVSQGASSHDMKKDKTHWRSEACVCVCVSGCFLQKIWQTSVMPSGQMFGLCNNLLVIMSCNEERGKRRILGENVLVQPPVHHWKREECLCGAPNLIWIVTNPVCHHKIPLQIPQSLGNSSMFRYLNQGV